jgi:hypothetical protein
MPAFITRTCPHCRKILLSASGENPASFGPPRAICGHCGKIFETGLSATPTAMDYFYLVAPYAAILLFWIVWHSLAEEKTALFWILLTGFTLYLATIGIKNYANFKRYKKELESVAGKIPTWR